MLYLRKVDEWIHADLDKFVQWFHSIADIHIRIKDKLKRTRCVEIIQPKNKSINKLKIRLSAGSNPTTNPKVH